MPPKKSGKSRKTSKSVTSKKNKAETASVESNHDAQTHKRQRSSSVGSTASSGSEVEGPMSKFQDFDVEQAFKEVEQRDKATVEANVNAMQDVNVHHDVMSTNSEMENKYGNQLKLQQNEAQQNAQGQHSNEPCNDISQHKIVETSEEEHNQQQSTIEGQNGNANYADNSNNNVVNGGNENNNNNHNNSDADGTVVSVQPQQVVSLAAIAALNIPRAVEAQNGLLKQPDAPRTGIPRVTHDGESAPPLPTELMQLLSAQEVQ